MGHMQRFTKADVPTMLSSKDGILPVKKMTVWDSIWNPRISVLILECLDCMNISAVASRRYVMLWFPHQADFYLVELLAPGVQSFLD